MGPLPGVTTAVPAAALPRLQRGALGLRATLASTLANLAPAMTIFLSITVVVAGVGSRAPWAFALAAVAMLAAGNTMAQFAKVLPSAGSFVTFISNGFGVTSRRAGTILGGVAFYLLLLSFPITEGAVVVFLGVWVATLFHWTAPHAWLLVTVGAIAAATPLLVRGVALSTRVSLLMFAVDAVGLVLLSVGVLLVAPTHRDAPLHDMGGAPGGFGGLAGLPFALAVFGYIGWENAGPLAEESTNPRRTIPLTIVASVLLIGALYVLSTWAAVVGFAAWHGPARGLALLGSAQETAPFLDLARHQLPWCAWLIGLAGVTSPLGCFLAEVTSQARIIFNGAREGLLPCCVTRVSATTRVPVVAVGLYVGLTVLLCVGPALWPHSNPVAIFSLEAGIGTVPILLVYLVANVALPVYMLRARRDLFNPLTHLIVPALGSVVLAYGVYAFVQPHQPAPGNTFWLYILALLLTSVAWTGVTLARNPSAVERVGSVLVD